MCADERIEVGVGPEHVPPVRVMPDPTRLAGSESFRDFGRLPSLVDNLRNHVMRPMNVRPDRFSGASRAAEIIFTSPGW
jgi:hypothetical protein